MIVFLAHIGSYVPAKSCKLGLFDGIYTSFNSLEKFDFSWELSNLLCLLKNCTNRSLVLLDEFGKNTDYLNGASLFCQVVQNFSKPLFQTNYILSDERNDHFNKIPLCFLATHFHDLIYKQLLEENYMVRFLTMEIILNSEEDCVYLYKIRPGKTNMSYALPLARKYF